jgi:putative transposase
MGRPLRIEYPGALYHVTSRGNEKKSIFLDKVDRAKFLRILREYRSRHGIVIHAYVLMNNHYHLLLETPRGNLLRVMHGINSGYTGYFNRKYQRVGHLFQGRYRALLVEKDQYLLSLSRYIHLNPVRAGVASRPEKYPYSSYGGYIGTRVREDWVEYDGVLSQFGRSRRRAEENYWKYVNEADQENENPLQNLFGQTVLGEEAFIERVKDVCKGKALDSEVIARKEYTRYPSLREIVMKVATIFEVEEKRVLTGESKPARDVALYLTHRYSGLSNSEIGKSFGGIHSSSVSQTVRRLQEKMRADKELAKVIQELESSVKIEDL